MPRGSSAHRRHGGVVYVPFLAQWLSIVDGRTGTQLTRLRGIDEQISMLRVTSQVAYYGSKQGVFPTRRAELLGEAGEATYGQVKIPRSSSGRRMAAMPTIRSSRRTPRRPHARAVVVRPTATDR